MGDGRTEQVKKPSDGDAGMQTSMVEHVVAALDTTDTGWIDQSDFVAWWAEHQTPGLPVMEKLKFSHPISNGFAMNNGTLSSSQFRKLLYTVFDEATSSDTAMDLSVGDMNPWL